MTEADFHDLDDRYNRERLLEILSRLRKTGGVPLDEKKRLRVASWFRTLIRRNLVECKALEDAHSVSCNYKTAFPNAMTRGQYTRAFLSYIGGLTDEEYQVEYPTIPRGQLVNMMSRITLEAGQELRKDKAAKRGSCQN